MQMFFLRMSDTQYNIPARIPVSLLRENVFQALSPLAVDQLHIRENSFDTNESENWLNQL